MLIGLTQRDDDLAEKGLKKAEDEHYLSQTDKHIKYTERPTSSQHRSSSGGSEYGILRYECRYKYDF